MIINCGGEKANHKSNLHISFLVCEYVVFVIMQHFPLATQNITVFQDQKINVQVLKYHILPPAVMILVSSKLGMATGMHVFICKFIYACTCEDLNACTPK